MGSNVIPHLALVLRRVAKSQEDAARYFNELDAALAPFSALSSVCDAAEARLARAYERTLKRAAAMREEQSTTMNILKSGCLEDLVKERDRLSAKKP